MPSAVIDLTEMVRMAMRRPGRSRLFQAWEKQSFTWVMSEPMLDEFIEVTDRHKFRRLIRPFVRDTIVEALRARETTASFRDQETAWFRNPES